MISPAYMFPKSRSECDSGFETYSTRLKRKLSGHSSGFEPKGAQKSSWMKPPTPFTLIAKPIISTQTVSASAKVVFTSAVGTMRKPCSAPGCSAVTSATMSDGQEVHGVHQQHPDEHRERERRDELVRSPWKMPFTWS